MMKCNAAVIHGVNQDWSVEEIEVDQPKAGEVLVTWTHAGLCHSDEHVSASFVPSCGRCRYCVTGRQNLCDQGGGAFLPEMITDGTSRHRLGDATDPLLLAKLGTFSEFPLADINVGYQDLRDGKNLRGVHA